MVTRRKKRTSASGPRPRRLAPRSSRKLRRTDAEMKTVALVTRELDEARQQQAATADVLKVISQSGAELGPVLDTLVAAAARICLAESGFIFRLQDGLCRMVASFGIPAEYKDFQARNPIAPGRGTLAGRTVLERRAVHIEDAAADPEYTRIEAVQLGNQRTMLGVPLVRDDALIGVITLARSRVEAFSEKEVAQVATFADQAVIAIENVRLFEEEATARAAAEAARDAAERARGEAAAARDAAEQARCEAEAANLAKSTFLATMSHEIRTPMNGVLGMIEVLERQGLTKDQRRIIVIMRESAQALLRIIDDVLDFSKIEAGRLELEATPFSLSGLVEGVLDTLRPQVLAKGLTLDAEIDAGSQDALIGDPMRVRQILSNLLSNAIKFTDHGGVRVHAGTLS